MQNAIVRINELQNEIKKQSKQIEGADKYIKEQLKLYKESIELRNKFVHIEAESQKLANDFLKNHTKTMKDIEKKLSSFQNANE